MTSGHDLLHRVEAMSQEDPLKAATIALEAEQRGEVAEWTPADRVGIAQVYVAAARRLVMRREPIEEVRERRRAAIGWLAAAVEAFIAAGEPIGAAEVLEQSGELSLTVHDHDAAAKAFERGAALAETEADHELQASCLSRLGTVRLQRGDLDGARDAYAAAREACIRDEDQRGEANALGALGDVAARADEVDEALDHYRRALDILAEIGDRRGQAHALKALGALESRIGEYEEAVDALSTALELFRDTWDRVGEGNTFQTLGNVAMAAGEVEHAIDYYREALACHAIASDLRGMAGDFGYLGRAAAKAGSNERAVLALESSYAMHSIVGARREAIINLKDQTTALLSLKGGTPTALACLRLAIDEGRTLDGVDTSSLEARFSELLDRVAGVDPDKAEQLEATLASDARAQKAAGLRPLLDDPVLAVGYYEDLLIAAEALEDVGIFLEALVGQARAMARADHLDGALAAVVVAEEALGQLGESSHAAARAMLDALRDELGGAGDETLRGDAESVRADAVLSVLTA